MMTLSGLFLLAIIPTADAGLSARELTPGVFVLGSSQRYGAANIGWVVLEDQVVLIGAPHPERLSACLEEVAKATKLPVRAAILTHVRKGEVESARALLGKGIDVVAQSDGAKALREALDRTNPKGDAAGPGRIREFADRLGMGDGPRKMDILAQGQVGGPGDAVVHVPQAQVLFAGALCVNGPRAELAGVETREWLRALKRLRELPCRIVVPGFGTPGDPSLLEREERFLRELRRQVGHRVAQGRAVDDVCKEVQITPGYLVWMPYDHPTREDVADVYNELTVPLAPFGSRGHPASDPRPKALVLIGDSPHDPDHIEAGLSRALEDAGVVPFVAVDVRTLTAENLKRFQLLVILRDGALFPNGREKPAVTWMTPEQERAIVDFVERGGGLLALHNATGIYPENGPYLKLLGGTYNGHGPLERFRVTVVDRSHPITRGVSDFEAADEQHTPVPDRRRVHLLLESRSAEGTIGAAGWAHAVGRGRVCYLANGHTREALDHPEYQKLLLNAAGWCLGRVRDEEAGR